MDMNSKDNVLRRLWRLIKLISMLVEHLLIKEQVCLTLLWRLEHPIDASFCLHWKKKRLKALSVGHQSLVLSLSVVQESWKDGTRYAVKFHIHFSHNFYNDNSQKIQYYTDSFLVLCALL